MARAGGEVELPPRLARLAARVEALDGAAAAPSAGAAVASSSGQQSPQLAAGIALRPHQEDGLRFLQRCRARGHGALLGDEMGVGKTLQVLALLTTLGPRARALVIGPLTVMHQWREEVARCAPVLEPSLVVYTGDKDERAELRSALRRRLKKQAAGSSTPPSGNSAPALVVLTTYEYAIRDAAFLAELGCETLAVDEAHRLKNKDSVLHGLLRTDIPGSFRILMTGTPVQNNLRELYALLMLAAPAVFKDKYEEDFVGFFGRLEAAECPDREARRRHLRKVWKRVELFHG